MLVGHTVVELTLCQFVHLLSTDSFNILNTKYVMQRKA